MNVAALQDKIRSLLKERNAVLLVHYYQRPEVQDIADILGDSLMLSLAAAKTSAEVIVFAGVHFMAESAAIICPDKTVLLPRADAGCALADMMTEEQLLKLKNENPGVPVITYINSAAGIKALSDACCTSSNAVKVVHSFTGAQKVIMAPDGNLARYTAGFTDKEIIPWNGYCPVHHFLSEDIIKDLQEKHPRALFVAHPECSSAVLALAEFVGGTEAILKFAKTSVASEFIIGTEMGILHQLEKQSPGKTFILASQDLMCRTMKYITLEDIVASLSGMQHIITVPEETRVHARKALDRMLSIP
jgi:quinolinate synthase